ncbi:FtsX-like permease family protein [Citreicoccus inhibens]|uniref:FtsX-like permease family protein n=1 Tax=Citreicoccus inhibens TaxID=2849499 RepID=UPI002E2CE728|nr:FtsX-like permease family protein [Citreicoccus inhibens]
MTLWWLTLQGVVSRPRSWVVGFLAAGAAALLTPGASLMRSIHDGTRRSLIESGAGDLQVYVASSPESPSVVPGPGGVPELVPMPDYAVAESSLRALPGVRDVVPLELGMGSTFRGNSLDDKLAVLRAASRAPASAERDARLRRLGEDLRRTLEGVARDSRRRTEAFVDDPVDADDLSALRAASMPAFWAHFTESPQDVLEVLENKVARQAGEGEELSVDYLGTDLPRFARAFPRFELVTGQLPPAGARGLLMGQATYEQSFKLPIAARLDELNRERERGATFAEDERLRTLVTRNTEEIPDLLARLDVERATALQAALARVLGGDGELPALLARFLALDDANFDARYGQFYAELAPHLPLYRLRPGDTLVLRNPLEQGPAIPMRLWGTFRFQGLGGDDGRANAVSLVDLVSARQLSGRLTRAQNAETQQLLETFGMQKDEALGRQSLDAFQPPEVVEGEARTTSSGTQLSFRGARAPPDTFTEDELNHGSAMHAAVLLAPGASAEELAPRIAALPGEVELASVGWQEAGGILAGLVGMTQVVLSLFALLLALFVALVSAGTLLLLARQRVGEVGTLRALGMQRSEVFASLLLEGLLLGGAGSVVGALVGAGLLRVWTGQGIAIQNSALQFFLGGPVLRPELMPSATAVVVLGVTAVVVLSALVPAWRGSSVAPGVAMRRSED